MSTTTNWRPDEALLSAKKREPDWAHDIRREAAEKFDDLPQPTRFDEPWRRTDISIVKFDKFNTFWDSLDSNESVDSLIPQDGFTRLHTGQGTQPENGALFLSGSEVTPSVPGLTAMPLALALHRIPDKTIAPYLQFVEHTSFDPSLYRFQAAVYAFRNAGCYVDVAPNTKLEIPLGLVSTLFTENSELNLLNIIHVGRGASLEIAEEFISPDDKRQLLSLTHTRIILEPEAKLRFTTLQNWGKGVFHFGTHHITLLENAELDLVCGGLGGRIAKSRIMVKLAGEGSRAKIGGFIAGAGRQHLDHDTTQRHVGRRTTSDLLFKGVVTDRARSLYQGMIVVEKSAQKTDAYQSVRHLNLSETAHVDALPGLEIYADDVRCTHGATTTPVDEEEIYYMACRGLSRNAAEELLIEAHLEPILARIPNRELQDRCRDAVTLKLVGHTI